MNLYIQFISIFIIKKLKIIPIFLILSCIHLNAQNISGIINNYYQVSHVDYCSNSVNVTNCSGLSIGDKVLIIQMQGSIIDSSNTISSGTILSYQSAGNYEFVVIDSMNGCQIIFKDSLLRTYDAHGAVQLVSVPIYTSVTVIDTLRSLPWNGTIGGVLVFEASGTVTLNAPIDVSNRGFLGGLKIPTCSSDCYLVQPHYVKPNLNTHSKGQGITTLLPDKWGGRGSMANGGGAAGGQAVAAGHNDAFYMGGGGGGNYGKGGRGGKSTTSCSIRYEGGLGGVSLSYSNTLNKLFMGGGGGSGHHRYPTTGPESGTNGGGIIIIKAQTLEANDKSILAYANDVPNIYNNVGRSGGGAGGTVLLDISNINGNLFIDVKGGKGGNNSGGQRVGPGGGGGGGIIWLKPSVIPTNLTYNINGGESGLQMSHSEQWGAENGQLGGIITNFIGIPENNKPFQFLEYNIGASILSPLCEGDTLFLFADTIPGNVTYTWSGPQAYSSSVQNPALSQITPLNAGTYTLTVTTFFSNTGMGSCSESVSVSNVIYPTPSMPVVNNSEVCFGFPNPTLVNIAASPGLVQWYNSSSLNTPIHTGNSYTPTVSAVDTFIYYITHTQNGCSSPADSAVFIIHPIPSSPIVLNEEICVGATVPNLIATGSGILNWYSDMALTNLVYTGSSFNTGQNTVGTYTYYVTQTINNCVSAPTAATLSIHPIPPAPSTGGNIQSCFGFPVPDFTATGIGTINWYDNGSLTNLLYTGSPFSCGQTNVGSYTYYVTQTVNNCQSPSANVTLNIYPIPTSPVSGGNIEVCHGFSVPNLTATGSGTINWYTDLALNNLVHSGSSFATGQTNIGTYTYYAAQVENNCLSLPTTISLTIHPIPSAPVSGGNQVICFGTPTPNLTANGTGTINWYNDISLNNLVYTGTSYATGVTNAGLYTYYVTQTINSCVSSSTEITLTIHPIPTAPISGGNQEVCFGYTIPNLTVSGAGILEWYDDVSLNNLLHTGNTYATGHTNVGLYTYYVTQTINNCKSAPTQISLTIHPTPPSPIAGINQEACFGFTIPDLTATGTGIIEWYDNVNYTNLLHTGTTYATGQSNVGTYIYYIVQSINSCYSPADTISLTIHPIPSSPVSNGNMDVCYGFPIPDLSVTASGTVQWYDDISLSNIVHTGTVFSTGQTAAGSYVYYTTQTINNCISTPTTVSLTIHPIPVAPTANNIEVCHGFPTPNLEATSIGTIKWYDDIALNNLVFTGSIFTSGHTNVGSYTYYVTQTINNCESPASVVTLTIHPIPSAPISGGNEVICEGVSIPTLTASGTGTIEWFDDISLSNLISTGNSYTPSVSSSGIYTFYTTQTINNCQSPETIITLTIHPIPTAPAANNEEVCIGFPIPDLSATGTGLIQWYSDAGLSNLIHTGSSFTTGETNVGTYTYYVTQTENNCESPATQVSLIIHLLPPPPVVNNTTACFGLPIPDLSATASGTINWYDNGSLALPAIHIGSTYATGQTNVGVYTYYVTQTIGSCESPSDTITLTIYPIPAQPISSNKEVCENFPVPDLDATVTGQINWYDDNTLQNLVSNNNPFASGHTTAGVYTYYVTQTENNCESPATSVDLTIHPTPPPPLTVNKDVCFGFPVPDLEAIGIYSMQWYSDPLLNNQIYTGNLFNTGETNVGVYTYYVTQIINSCESPSDTVYLTIHPIPLAPVINDIEVCFNTTVPDFQAAAVGQVNWYTDVATTNLVHTGISFASGQTAVGIYTYYVTQTVNNCESPPTEVHLTIHPIPNTPTGSNYEICFGEPTPNLEVSGTGIIEWYSDIALTNLIFTGSSFMSGHTNVNTYTYYVIQTENQCKSLPLTISLTIHPIPIAPSANDTAICFGNPSPIINALGTGLLKWYDNVSLTPPEINTGSSFNTTETNVGAYDYYITQTVNNCESPASSVTLTIYPIPTPPITQNESCCYGSLVPPLTVSGTGLIEWFTDPSLTPPAVFIGSVYNTNQTNNGTYTYYVTQTENNCTSDSVPIILTIIPLPPPPTSNNVTICYGNPTPNLQANGIGVIKWYGDSLLTNLLNTGNSFSTGETNVGIYTYYVTQTHNTTGCESFATTVTLTINPIPAQPIVNNFYSCTGQPTPNFQATGSGTIYWYADALLTNNVFIGNPFPSGHTLAGTYTYYVSQLENGCMGPASEITLTIYQTPIAPISNNEEICYGFPTPDLVANGTGTIEWYSDNLLTNLLYTGTNFTTGETNVGLYTYYVVQTENGCTSPYQTVTLTIHPTPAAPIIINQNGCFGLPIPNLTATANGIVEWYNDISLTPPVLHTGLTYTTGETAVGTYTYYAINIENGCNSPITTATLNIHDIPLAPQGTSEIVCYGLSVPSLTAIGVGNINWFDTPLLTPPALFIGNSFNTGQNAVGTYTYYVSQEVNGCYSPADTVNLTIVSIPSTPIVNNQAACFNGTIPDLFVNGSVATNWYNSTSLTPPPIYTGNTYNTGQTAVGIYTYYVTQFDSLSGCESLPDSISLTIYPIPPAPIASDTSICFGSSTPNLTATGIGQIKWYNDVTLTPPAIFQGSSYATGQTAVGSYDYYVTQTINNCESPATHLTLTIYPIPQTPSISSNSPVCEGSSILLFSDTIPNAIYEWTGPLGFTSNDQNPIISNSNFNQNGFYSLIVYVNNCPSVVSDINVEVLPGFSPIITGNSPFCLGQSTTLDAGSSFVSFIWSTGETTQTIVVTAAGTYIATVTDANGCTGVDSVVATFSPPPFTDAGPDREICEGFSVQLNGFGGVSYEWSPTNSLSNPSVSNPLATPSQTTQYFLTITDNMGCSGIDSVLVTVHPKPEIDISTNIVTGCNPLLINFEDLSTPNVITWEWHFGDQLSGVNNTSNLINPIHVYANPGTYTVSLTVSTIHGCTNDTIYPDLISVYPWPKADFTYTPPYADINNYIIYFFNQSINSTRWLWSFGDGSHNSTSYNPTHEYNEGGTTYEVILIAQNDVGCSDTTRRSVLVKPLNTIYAPNAFTPNGDGLNDYFMPMGQGMKNENFKLYIFNRWGGLVFETSDYNIPWDGNSPNGEPAPEGVYTWVLYFDTFEKSDERYRHIDKVTLIRNRKR